MDGKRFCQSGFGIFGKKQEPWLPALRPRLQMGHPDDAGRQRRLGESLAEHAEKLAGVRARHVPSTALLADASVGRQILSTDNRASQLATDHVRIAGHRDLHARAQLSCRRAIISL
jgi:hypothetical protein